MESQGVAFDKVAFGESAMLSIRCSRLVFPLVANQRIIDESGFEVETSVAGSFINDCAGQLSALETDGSAPVGCRFLPGDIVMAAFMAIDPFSLRHGQSVSNKSAVKKD